MNGEWVIVCKVVVMVLEFMWRDRKTSATGNLAEIQTGLAFEYKSGALLVHQSAWSE
jgi:hypothetical protein